MGVAFVTHGWDVRHLLPLGAMAVAACGLGSAPPAPSPNIHQVQGSLRVLIEQLAMLPRPAVVMLEPLQDVRVPPSRDRVVRVASSGDVFDPQFVVADTGDTIVFVNQGALKHDLFSPDIGMDVSFPVDPRSEFWSLNFLGAGRRSFFCSLHPDEAFSIFVSNTPFRAVVDRKGRYRITQVPAGTYRLAIWSEAATGPIRTVHVNGRGAIVENIWLDPERLE